MQPYEAKLVRQYWYPIHEIGGVKNATLDAAVNLEVSRVGSYRTLPPGWGPPNGRRIQTN